MAKDKLFTRSYVCILAANFLLFFGFWLLVPVLPFYLKETYGCEEMIIGAVLSCYTVSCLCVRPFSGFLMDRFPRKPIYILCYFVCVMMFPAYTAAAAISWFIALRALHGVAFGGVTVGGNTLCVDIMPSSRRGEGLGYYGLTNNIAMALGPMTGLFMHDHFTYIQIFISGMLVSVAGFVCAVAVKARMPESLRARRQMEAAGDTPAPQVTRKLSLDRFILIKGIPVSVSLFLLSIPYGATTNFVAMYAREIHITAPAGLFFTFMALGMGASRIVAGKKVAVVGGGNVAMDAARTALRLGAEVHIVYRRSEAELPARVEEVHHAKEEGVIFDLLTNPKEILVDDKGWVKGMKVIKMELGEPAGRRQRMGQGYEGDQDGAWRAGCFRTPPSGRDPGV